MLYGREYIRVNTVRTPMYDKSMNSLQYCTNMYSYRYISTVQVIACILYKK